MVDNFYVFTVFTWSFTKCLVCKMPNICNFFKISSVYPKHLNKVSVRFDNYICHNEREGTVVNSNLDRSVKCYPVSDCASDRRSLKSADHLKIRRDFKRRIATLSGRIDVFSPRQVLVERHPKNFYIKDSFDWLVFVEYVHHCVLEVFSSWHLWSRKENHLCLLSV